MSSLFDVEPVMEPDLAGCPLVCSSEQTFVLGLEVDIHYMLSRLHYVIAGKLLDMYCLEHWLYY